LHCTKKHSSSDLHRTLIDPPPSTTCIALSTQFELSGQHGDLERAASLHHEALEDAADDEAWSMADGDGV
jgi:hypothetical protein